MLCCQVRDAKTFGGDGGSVADADARERGGRGVGRLRRIGRVGGDGIRAMRVMSGVEWSPTHFTSIDVWCWSCLQNRDRLVSGTGCVEGAACVASRLLATTVACKEDTLEFQLYKLLVCQRLASRRSRYCFLVFPWYARLERGSYSECESRFGSEVDGVGKMCTRKSTPMRQSCFSLAHYIEPQRQAY